MHHKGRTKPQAYTLSLMQAPSEDIDRRTDTTGAPIAKGARPVRPGRSGRYRATRKPMLLAEVSGVLLVRAATR